MSIIRDPDQFLKKFVAYVYNIFLERCDWMMKENDNDLFLITNNKGYFKGWICKIKAIFHQI